MWDFPEVGIPSPLSEPGDGNARNFEPDTILESAPSAPLRPPKYSRKREQVNPIRNSNQDWP